MWCVRGTDERKCSCHKFRTIEDVPCCPYSLQRVSYRIETAKLWYREHLHIRFVDYVLIFNFYCYCSLVW